MRRALMLVAGVAAVIGLTGGEAMGAAGAVARPGAVAGGVLPKGFLLYEAEAAGPSKPWETWHVSDRVGQRLAVNPCGDDPAPKGRAAARGITHTVENDYTTEQVIIYRDRSAARKAMSSLRADLERCATHKGTGHDGYSYKWKKTAIGDDALRVGGFFFESRVRYVVVRKGRALALYSGTGMVTSRLLPSHFRPLVKDARTMAGRLCRLRHVCD
ncbi:hypothetical protein [Sphaerisporangium sp. NPDC051011]|uniref:hypothetical protein n=1 Tax=Sphaerisporangium sp. NPDC051011 TaxID=3155792 RepID=UPI0033F70778